MTARHCALLFRFTSTVSYFEETPPLRSGLRSEPRASARGFRWHGFLRSGHWPAIFLELCRARIVSIGMGQNSRFAIRTLLKNPGFTLIAVFALALGIGANTAIFTVVDRVLLRPLAYDNAGRLVNISRKFKTGASPSMSIPKFAAIRDATLLEAVTVYDFMGPGMNLSGGGHPEQVRGVHVSEAYFRMLGVAPLIGRTFSSDRSEE